jgi:hypothetical protein
MFWTAGEYPLEQAPHQALQVSNRQLESTSLRQVHQPPVSLTLISLCNVEIVCASKLSTRHPLQPAATRGKLCTAQASSLRCHSWPWDPNQGDPTPLLSVRGCKWGPTPQSSYTIHYYCITTAFLLHFYRVIAKLLPFCLMKVYYYQLLPNTSIITVLRILFTFEKISLYR